MSDNGNGNRRKWTPQDWASWAGIIIMIGGGIYALGSTSSKIDALGDRIARMEQSVSNTASALHAEIQDQVHRIDGVIASQNYRTGHP